MGRIADTTIKYWLYDSERDEFHMDLTTSDVCGLTGCASGYVNVVCKNNIYLNNRWIVFDADTYKSPSAFLAYFVLPARIKIQALEPLREMWGKRIYDSFWRKYKRPNQIIQLDDKGNEIKEFKKASEAAKKLDMRLSKLRMRVNRAVVMKKKPAVCRRKDYMAVLKKHYPAKYKELSLKAAEQKLLDDKSKGSTR